MRSTPPFPHNPCALGVKAVRAGLHAPPTSDGQRDRRNRARDHGRGSRRQRGNAASSSPTGSR
ncbi:hypothetical protein, partial [Rhodanobacter sp. 115]|uniref:hypothetical protein n=1 Tax=Rhodanobacter sp. FW021-MT20 TaxID=1162282 RepID=UPI001ED8EB42